jgi:cell division protein FtsL
MVRLNLLLLALLTVCALGLVTSQHKARKLFVELEEQQERARSLEVEYGQLQLEASTWAMHTRVERIATRALRMHTPEAKRIQIVTREAQAQEAAR